MKKTTILTRILILFLWLQAPTQLLSQEVSRYGSDGVVVGFALSATGSGHGAFWSPSIGTRQRANEIGLSILLRRSNEDADGFRTTYSRNLTGLNVTGSNFSRLQLNFTAIFQYVRKCRLSEASAKEEKTCARGPQKEVDWTKVKVSSVEIGAGIELRINLTSRLYIRNYILFTPYFHPVYYPGMDQQRFGTTIALGTGIGFRLASNTHKRSLSRVF